MSKANVFPLY